MISEEEKKAIDEMKSLYVHSENITYEQKFAIETILSMIKEKDEKIKHLENLNNHQSKDMTKAVDYTFKLNKKTR